MRTRINNPDNDPERLALIEKPGYETEQFETTNEDGPYARGNSVGPIGELFAHHYLIAAPALIVFRILVAVLNRILYKIMLEPMGEHSFFLTLSTSFVYVALYGTLFMISYFAGWITDRGLFSKWALGVPKWKLVAMGFCDCFGNVLGIVTAGHIKGSILVIISTLITPMTMICSFIAFRTRYCTLQILAAVVVISGICVTVITNDGPLANGRWYYFAINIIGLLPNAISFTLKESVFSQLPGINVLVLNLFSSLFAVAFMPVGFLFANLPGIANLPRVKCGSEPFDGIKGWFSCFVESLKSIPAVIQDGLSCFIGHTPEVPHPPVAAPTPTPLVLPNVTIYSNPFGLPDHPLLYAASLEHTNAFFGGSPTDALVMFDAPRVGVGAMGLLDGTATPVPAPSHADRCSPMPYPWLMYAAVNVLFNISMLLVVKYGGGRPQITATGIKTTTSGTGAVVNLLVGLVASALQFYAFSLPIFPSYAKDLQQPLPWTAHVGFAVTVIGLALFQYISHHWRKLGRALSPAKPPCFSFFPIGYYRVEPNF